MLTKYIQAAMHQATYELLGDGTFYGEIPDFQGVWEERRYAGSLPRRAAISPRRLDAGKD